MKKSGKLLILFISLAALLTSCSEQLTLTKRHYKSGYYIDFSNNKHVDALPVAGNKNTNDKQNITTLAAITSTQEVKTDIQVQNQTAVVTPATVSKKARAKTPVIKYTSSKTVASGKTTSEVAENKVSELSSDAADNLTQANSTSDVIIISGLSLILIVIITIFIPPLGVALVYGIDLHFWIDLILTLLFFIPGLIYGLVVVLM
jgi:uncharacterized membrane protein YqaE (UPF0057 family)